MDVPAQFLESDHIRNQVVVRSGTNWDLSRSAAASPMKALPDDTPVELPAPRVLPPPPLVRQTDYLPDDGVPAGQPVLRFFYLTGRSKVNDEHQEALDEFLRHLDPKTKVVVVGHAGPNETGGMQHALLRAKWVRKALEVKTPQVQMKYFGAARPLHGASEFEQPRVEVFLIRDSARSKPAWYGSFKKAMAREK